jgi:hypothetical protein
MTEEAFILPQFMHLKTSMIEGVIQDQKNTAGMGISRDDSYKIYYPNDQI